MRNPNPDMIRRLTPEEMRSWLKPCPLCGAREQEIAPGIFLNIQHDYSKHPGMFARPNEQRREE